MEGVLDSAVVVERYQAYKDSGVEWLGEVPEHWELLANKYIFKLKRVQVGKKSKDFRLLSLTTNGVIERDMLNPQGKFPAEFDTYQEVKRGDFIFCLFDVEETPRTIGLSDYNGMITGAYSVMESNDAFDRKFLYYFYLNLDADKRMKSLYTGLRNTISKENFFSFKTFCPTIDEQASIAQFLDHRTALLENAISIKEKQISLLKERRQMLIHNAVTKGLNPDVPMKDSGVEWIGEIPEHWEVKRLKYILKSQGRIGFKGYTTSDLVDQNEGALTLGASHLDWDGNINLIEPVYISWKKYYESPEIMVSRNDIIIVQRGSTCGKVALIQDDLGPTTINPSLVLLKQISGDSEYIFYGIKVVLSGILNLVSNTAIPMLSQFQINNIAIAVPPRREQQLIVSALKHRARKIDGAISIKEQEIQKLKEYKATLINSAVTGKIKIT